MRPETANPSTELEEHLRFETLIGHLSSRFVILPASEVDREILDALRRVCAALGLDFAALWQWSDEAPGFLMLTHYHSLQEGPRPAERVNGLESFPWVHREMLAGRAVVVSALAELPSEAARDRESACQLGIKSNVTLPLSVGGGPAIGALAFNTTRAECDWPEAKVRRLQLVAQILANALARKRADQALRESEERLSLAAESAEAALWGLDCRRGVFWATDKARAIFGYAPDEVITMARFQAFVHPDDWSLVQSSLKQAMQADNPIHVEYRILRADGQTRWILSRGRTRFSPNGAAERVMGISVDVTDRKGMEQAMHASQARLEAGSDLAGLGYYEVDYDARTCFLDERFRQICGVPAEVKQGLDPVQFWLEHVHADDRQRLLKERQGMHEGNTGQISAEYRYLHPARGQRWIHHLARLTERAVGERGARTFGVIEDTTEHKQMLQQQAEDLRFMTLIAELSSKFVNLPVSEVDREILDALRGICEVLDLDLTAVWQWSGSGPGRFIATHYYNALQGPQPPGDLKQEEYPWLGQQLLAGRLNVFASLDDFPAAAAVDRENCRRLGIKSHLSLPLAIGGQPTFGILGLNTVRQQRDWPDALVKRIQLFAQIFANAISRKRAELALREREEIDRATFEQAAVGIAHVGTDGGWLRVNDRLCAIVGYSREELLALTFQDITHPDDLEKDLSYVRQVLSGEINTYSIEKRYFRKDASIVWVNLTVSLVRTMAGEPKHFISVVEDITERKRAEEEMERLRLQLWHADRVAQTGAITGSLAHELNQPLTGILSTAQAGLRFMAGGNLDLAEMHGILTSIVHDTKRAGAVINGLRAMLRHKEPVREPVSLAEAMEGVLGLLHSELIARQVEYDLRVESDCQVKADKAQIQQVLLNLLVNALEAMQGQPTKQPRVELSLARTPAGEALVSVRDFGPGIPQAQEDKLFKAFWTTKPQGMGIGLPISCSIIESHGGRLWYANNPDRGATFSFSLPVVAKEGRGEGDQQVAIGDQ